MKTTIINIQIFFCMVLCGCLEQPKVSNFLTSPSNLPSATSFVLDESFGKQGLEFGKLDARLIRGFTDFLNQRHYILTERLDSSSSNFELFQRTEGSTYERLSEKILSRCDGCQIVGLSNGHLVVMTSEIFPQLYRLTSDGKVDSSFPLRSWSKSCTDTNGPNSSYSRTGEIFAGKIGGFLVHCGRSIIYYKEDGQIDENAPGGGHVLVNVPASGVAAPLYARRLTQRLESGLFLSQERLMDGRLQIWISREDASLEPTFHSGHPIILDPLALIGRTADSFQVRFHSDSQGRVLIRLKAWTSYSSVGHYVLRLKSSGELDTNFGNENGFIFVGATSDDDSEAPLALLPDDTFFVAFNDYYYRGSGGNEGRLKLFFFSNSGQRDPRLDWKWSSEVEPNSSFYSYACRSHYFGAMPRARPTLAWNQITQTLDLSAGLTCGTDAPEYSSQYRSYNVVGTFRFKALY